MHVYYLYTFQLLWGCIHCGKICLWGPVGDIWWHTPDRLLSSSASQKTPLTASHPQVKCISLFFYHFGFDICWHSPVEWDSYAQSAWYSSYPVGLCFSGPIRCQNTFRNWFRTTRNGVSLFCPAPLFVPYWAILGWRLETRCDQTFRDRLDLTCS